MRYWEITITNPATGLVVKSWSSMTKTGPDYQALQVEMDVSVYFGMPGDMKSTVFIYGVSLRDLEQANNFSGLVMTVKGGMSGGLPLENPTQRGTLFVGYIFEVFGNWVGTDMELGFALTPTPFTTDNPGGFVLNWQKGQTLQVALQNLFAIVLPGIKVQYTLQTVVAQSTFTGIYRTLGELAEAIDEWTGQNGSPVFIGVHGGTIIVTDHSQTQTPVQIAFTDLIGQPTWVEKYTMQLQTAMRSDIVMGGGLKMPRHLSNFAGKLQAQGANDIPGFVTTQASAFPSQSRYLSTFAGEFLVKSVRQVGNSRSPSGDGWVTVVAAIAAKP